MYKLLIDKSDATPALKELLGKHSESLNRDGKHVALKGDSMDQESANTVLETYLADKENLDAIITNEEKIRAAIKDLKAFGDILIQEFGVRNRMANKTDQQIDDAVDDLLAVFVAVKAGSLPSAKRKALSVTPSYAVTQDDIDWFVSKIDEKMGVS